MKPLRPILALAGVLLVASPRATAADDPAQPLRYGWKPGESYVYSVRVELEGEHSVATLEGNSTYTVKAAGEGGFTLVHRGRLMPQVRTKDGRPDPLATMPLMHFSPFSGVGIGMPGFLPDQTEMKVDDRGNVLTTTGSSQLPMLGNLSRLVLEPLPEELQETWEIPLAATIEEAQERRFPGPGPMFGPFGPGFRSPTTSYQAEGRTVYTRGAPEGDAVPIAKGYELKTRELVNGMPRRTMTGRGTITFDTKVGVPRALEFTATLTENSANTTIRVPMKVSYKLLEGAEREKVLNPPKPAPAATTERPPTSVADVDRVLTDLQSPDEVRRRMAANRLVVLQPSDRRSEVARALVPLLRDGDLFTRQAAARALGNWGTKQSVPALIEAVDDTEFSVRWAAIEALGRLGDERAARPIAAHLGSDAIKAVPALRALGPAAEAAVLEVVEKEFDRGLRTEACRLLETIGTARSIPALERVAREDSGPLGRAAQQAVRAIASRP